MVPTFPALGVPLHMVHRLARMGISKPTALQRGALEALMPPTSPSRLDKLPASVVLRWPTGSGKTLAFALPLVARLDPQLYGTGIQALILSPTRELCIQTLHIMKKLTGMGKATKGGNRVKVMSLMGQSCRLMESELKHQPPDIVVGTPHLIAALRSDGKLPLIDEPTKRLLVLDEVDALAAPFRWRHVAQLLGVAPEGSTQMHARGNSRKAPAVVPRVDHHNWMKGRLWLVSADTPQRVVDQCFHQAGHTEVAPLVLKSAERVPNTLRHVLLSVPGVPLSTIVRSILDPISLPSYATPDATTVTEAALPASVSIDEPTSLPAAAPAAALRNPEDGPDGGVIKKSARRAILVFVDSSAEAVKVQATLRREGIRSAAVHNEDGRKARKEYLDRLAEGKLQVLVATDLLARGVDIKGATHVINVSVPVEQGTYLHRAGRVGRTGGSFGTVVSLTQNKREDRKLQGYAAELGFALEAELEAVP